MTEPLVVTIPADDQALREDIERQLAPYGDVVVQPPAAFDLGTIKLIVEVTAGGLAIIKTLLEIRALHRKSGKPSNIRVGGLGERGVALEDADEALLRRLLGAG